MSIRHFGIRARAWMKRNGRRTVIFIWRAPIVRFTALALLLIGLLLAVILIILHFEPPDSVEAILRKSFAATGPGVSSISCLSSSTAVPLHYSISYSFMATCINLIRFNKLLRYTGQFLAVGRVIRRHHRQLGQITVACLVSNSMYTLMGARLQFTTNNRLTIISTPDQLLPHSLSIRMQIRVSTYFPSFLIVLRECRIIQSADNLFTGTSAGLF